MLNLYLFKTGEAGESGEACINISNGIGNYKLSDLACPGGRECGSCNFGDHLAIVICRYFSKGKVSHTGAGLYLVSFAVVRKYKLKYFLKACVNHDIISGFTPRSKAFAVAVGVLNTATVFSAEPTNETEFEVIGGCKCPNVILHVGYGSNSFFAVLTVLNNVSYFVGSGNPVSVEHHCAAVCEYVIVILCAVAGRTAGGVVPSAEVITKPVGFGKLNGIAVSYVNGVNVCACAAVKGYLVS